jgi:hypothetical protein
VVPGLMHAEELYVGNPKLSEMKVLAKPESLDRELENDAVAIYQVGDDLYTHQRYRIEAIRGGRNRSQI